MSERLVCDAPLELFAFLATRLSSWHRNTLRERLRSGCVSINGRIVTRRDHALSVGDEVLVATRSAGRTERRTPHGRRELPVLHADEHLIAIDKPAGLLAVSTDRQRERTALALLRDQLSRPDSPARLWPVHRLDRETSGVLLFARSRGICDDVRSSWSAVAKTYLAVVEGVPALAEGTIDQPLWEDRALFVHVGRQAEAKAARSHYRQLATRGGRTLLEVRIDTGRRHQIRAHLAWLGHPVLGDKRYGTAGPALGLHALRLELPHPRSEQLLVLEAPAPRAFHQLFRPGRATQ